MTAVGRIGVQEGHQFFLETEDGRRHVLLDAWDVYGNHSQVSMGELDSGAYGVGRQREPFFDTMLKYLKSIANEDVRYSVILLLMVKDLWKKPRPLNVLWVGGSAGGGMGLCLAEMLRLFHPESRLCRMVDHGGELPLTEGVTLLPMELGGIQMAPRQYDVLVLDDTCEREIPTYTVKLLLSSLKPFGSFFCMTSRKGLAAVCSQVMPKLGVLPTGDGKGIFLREFLYEDWSRAYLGTPQGQMEMRTAELRHRMEQTVRGIARLESMGDAERKKLLGGVKDLEVFLTEQYSFLVSTDCKVLATRLREALIDWHLGNAGIARVRTCLEKLKADLRKYDDLRLE